MNWFIVLIGVLQVISALYFWMNKSYPLGFVQFFIGLANFAMVFVKYK